MTTVNPKKVFELDERFFMIRKKSFESNDLAFFKDYEHFLGEYDKYDSSETITTTVFGRGIVRRIPQCDGTKALASIGEILQPNKLSIDDKRINEPSRATGDTQIEVHKVVKDATCGNVFFSFKKDLNDLCFTQHQIMVFFEKYRHRLNPDGRNAFLSKIDGHFVIFNLFLSASDEQWIYHLLEFEDFKKYEWLAVNKQFIVIPSYEAKLK